MREDNDVLIDKMIRAFERCSFDSGKILDPDAWWPLNHLYYSPLYINDFYKTLLGNFELLKKKYTLREIADAISYPSATWLLVVSAPHIMKSMGIEKEKRVSLILEFLKMIQMQMAGNIFCEDGGNIIWDKNRVERLMSEIEWVNIRKDSKLNRLFARLHAALLSLNEAIFRNCNNVAREVHGPYKIKYGGQPAQLIVREYYNLRDPALEPKLKDLPYESIKTYAIYDNAVKFDFPVLNDYTHDLPLVEHALAVAGRIKESAEEKNLSNTKSLEKVCEVLEKKNYQISMAVEQMAKEDQILESLRRVYYWAKRLNAKLNKSWEPPKRIMERVRKELRSFPEPKPFEMTREQFRALIDPRVD